VCVRVCGCVGVCGGVWVLPRRGWNWLFGIESSGTLFCCLYICAYLISSTSDAQLIHCFRSQHTRLSTAFIPTHARARALVCLGVYACVCMCVCVRACVCGVQVLDWQLLAPTPYTWLKLFIKLCCVEVDGIVRMIAAWYTHGVFV
jgi:hypothetical protein